MSDETTDAADKAEGRRHSESLFWAELKPKLWNLAGMALLVTAVAVGMSMSGAAAVWALLPLAGAVFSFYEARVTENEFYLHATRSVSDVDSEQWTKNLAKSQQKAQNKQVDSAPSQSADTHKHSFVGDAATAPVVDEPSGKWTNIIAPKDPVQPLAHREASSAHLRY